MCEMTAWYGARRFPDDPEDAGPTYWLCKWCGFRWLVSKGVENGTLALPVYHDCPDGCRRLTWHQVESGETYLTKTWPCDCGETLMLCKTLRPFPQFCTDPWLVENAADW